MSDSPADPNPNATWLPNLVGGVSIWKLAVDLNEAKFFDGRLLVPETEGSESLPVTVRWDLTGLVPLVEALRKHPDDVATAVKDFQAALERVAKVFSTPASGYDKYKQAFTVPSLEADGGGNYFYSPSSKKLFVINWGASPRAMGGKAEYVFGYEDWNKVFEDKALAGGAAVGAAGAAIAATQAVKGAKDEKEEKDEKKAEKKEKNDDGKARPWWFWPLFALIAIALVLGALFLLRACEEQQAGPHADSGADAAAEAGEDAAGASDDAAAEAGGEDAGAIGAGDAMADAASADAASADAASADAATTDGGNDGGHASNDDDDDDDDTGGGGGGGSGGSGGGGGGGGKVIVTLGGAGGGNGPAAKSGPHRRHYQADAVKWRIVAGNDRVSRTEQRGRRFDVWLGPGRTFQGVAVEWQDAGGKWHAH
ncbi:MAG: hypothetical protein KF819_01555 [Labilithrix sp.]|nr:hypothetical protein [Labilithrix sp.]